MYDIFEKLKQLQRPAQPAATGPVEWIVAGLGNVGTQYENTRHNAGFLAADACAKAFGCKLDKLKFKSYCGDAMVAGHRILLMKPTTFMNLSGEALREAMQFYKIPPEKAIILFDDVSLDVGKLRIRRKGSDGGHNGIKNIIYLSGSDAFPRVKIGVGKKPHPDYDLADWVLGHFSPEDSKTLDALMEKVPEIVSLMVQGKTDEAMNRFNS